MDCPQDSCILSLYEGRVSMSCILERSQVVRVGCGICERGLTIDTTDLTLLLNFLAIIKAIRMTLSNLCLLLDFNFQWLRVVICLHLHVSRLQPASLSVYLLIWLSENHFIDWVLMSSWWLLSNLFVWWEKHFGFWITLSPTEKPIIPCLQLRLARHIFILTQDLVPMSRWIYA